MMEETIIQALEDNILIAVLENGDIVEQYEFNSNYKSKVGNIYIGKVKDVLEKNNSIFVDYGEKKAGYLQLSNMDRIYKKGENIIVQVKKNEEGSKGAKLTSSLSIGGKYIVLLIDSNIRSISSKIEHFADDLMEKITKMIPENFGIIVRTEAQNVNSDIVLKEVEKLLSKYNKINSLVQNEEIGLIYDANCFEDLIVQEFIKSSTKKLYINNEEIYNKIVERLGFSDDINNSNMSEIVYSKVDFIDEFGLRGKLEKAKERKIWLKSSGYIAIDKTEALTAIDVNSGKFEGKKGFNKEEFALKINKEAAIEVMKQIRLKNIGGIIIVDFINMKQEEDKQAILDILNKEKNKDRGKVEIVDYTRLGLVEIARKKL